MPLPKPRKGEREDSFIDRCMADPAMRGEYPDASQRAAVCHSQWDGKDKNSMSLNAKPKWMSTGYLKAAPTGEVSADRGVIEGVSVVTAGEAQGHGVNLDSEFVATVVEMGNSKRQGLKARFGHPNMCSTALGTFIGRFKNFRGIGEQAKADLFLSNEAKDTPHGNLYDYVMGMAENEADMFGTSIVFSPGETYVRDESGEKIYDYYEVDPSTGMRFTKPEYEDWPVFVECNSLHACDAVDEPAANEGLFSKFSQETMAGQITEFLDLHPQIWTTIEHNPRILQAIARYGERIEEFINRYRAYVSGRQKEDGRMTTDNSEETTVATEEGATEETEQLEATEATGESTESTETPAESESTEQETEQTEEPAETETVEETQDEEQEPEAMSRDEFIRITDDFGAEIAAQTVKDGGDYYSAQGLRLKALEAENEQLKERVTELEAIKTGTPAKVETAKTKAKLFNTGANKS